uniref:Uncharacterized protein n=1 Tax=Cacopsylla melanoneura TaxID=428564 RepID=A0A8D8WL35_9HEMI
MTPLLTSFSCLTGDLIFSPFRSSTHNHLSNTTCYHNKTNNKLCIINIIICHVHVNAHSKIQYPISVLCYIIHCSYYCTNNIVVFTHLTDYKSRIQLTCDASCSHCKTFLPIRKISH